MKLCWLFVFLIFKVAPAEVDALIKAFKDPSGIRAGGLKIGGVKYIALGCDERSVYGKQVNPL